MTEPSGGPRPDVTDMYAVHGVFRDTLGEAPELVGGVAPGDVARLELIANYYENILSFLHGHHEGEDLLVFPLLRERCPEDLAELDTLAAGHTETSALMAGAQSALAAWPAGGEAAQPTVLDALEALRVGLVAHLEEEEANGLPLAAEHLTMEEWGALPGHGMGSFEGDKIWLIMGLIRERMNEDQRAAMDMHLPPPALEMWNGFGHVAFAELAVEVPVEVRNRVP